jgi:tRNA G37 N-methylase Trm5
MFAHTIDDLKKLDISKKNGSSGIYLWGVKYQNRYIPLNVGKGKNIHERIFQHLSRWRGGEYRVPDWDVIVGKRKKLIAFTADEKLLYIPHGANQYTDFLKNKEIQNVIQKVIENFFCILLPIENSNLLDDEDALATLVGKDRLISSHRKNDTKPTQYAQDLFNYLDDLNKKTCP